MPHPCSYCSDGAVWGAGSSCDNCIKLQRQNNIEDQRNEGVLELLREISSKLDLLIKPREEE